MDIQNKKNCEITIINDTDALTKDWFLETPEDIDKNCICTRSHLCKTLISLLKSGRYKELINIEKSELFNSIDGN